MQNDNNIKINQERLTADVTDKLSDLGALVNNDLPTYIVNLILNQHSIEFIRSDLALFLDSVNVPFMDWLEVYLEEHKNQQQQNSSSSSIKKECEIISANELEDEILDFEEDQNDEQQQDDDHQLKSECDDDLQNEFNSSVETTKELTTNKRKHENNDLNDDLELSNKKMMNNDKESIKLTATTGSNLIKLNDNAHLNDIGLMRRKAMQEKQQQKQLEQEEKQKNNANNNNNDNNKQNIKQERQSTPNQQDRLDDYVDLREKLNLRKKKDHQKSSRIGGSNDDDDDAEMNSNDDDNNDNDDEKKERCKFWPFCKKESDCIYAHPTKQCKQFPSCKLGADKCLDIHPLCKFDLVCTKNDCPFLHIAKKQQVALPALIQPQMMHVECKFYPNCFNPNCPFIHPRLCIYGSGCKNPTCTFKHPTETTAATANQNIAKPHQLKWTKNSSSNNNDKTTATAVTTTKTENQEIDDQLILKHENDLIDCDEIKDVDHDEDDDQNDELNDSNLEEYDDQMEIKIKAE